MLQKTTCFEQAKDLGEIILGSNEENSEIYKIIKIDNLSIRLLRRGQYSRMRILPFQNILDGEWYYDNGIPDNIKSNTDSQLLKSRSPEQENSSEV